MFMSTFEHCILWTNSISIFAPSGPAYTLYSKYQTHKLKQLSIALTKFCLLPLFLQRQSAYRTDHFKEKASTWYRIPKVHIKCLGFASSMDVMGSN